MGGFGSAVLEAAADAGLNTSHIRRLGIPDKFIEHGERGELLADLGLDALGIAPRRAACVANRTACRVASRGSTPEVANRNGGKPTTAGDHSCRWLACRDAQMPLIGCGR